MQIRIPRYSQIEIHVGAEESEAVRIAARNLLSDFRKVLDVHTYDALAPALTVEIHTLVSGAGEQARDAGEQAHPAAQEGVAAGGEDTWQLPESLIPSLAKLRTPAGAFRKEGYLIGITEDAVLYLVGTDRRGTVYAIYEFSRQMLGVSPWHFMADVPVRRREAIVLDTKGTIVEWPSVEYRGIFINDEEELEHWAQRYNGEETIGYKTYEQIFELLLRLRLNVLWPAMHVNSFNTQRDCAALADRMGIVIGTSHCDMLMRSNFREWEPWCREKGYEGAAYDYSIPGRNREILREYWGESVDMNKDDECCYTLGMRGIHDSGFETSALADLTGEALRDAKVAMLQEVIEMQDALLQERLPGGTLKTFVPYKEVLDLYDHGLQVPEGVTLIWVNDNYGYVRRYPTAAEQARAGGNGLYYHNSYWAAADDEGSYTFITTIPLAHTRNELRKAWEDGIRKIWVTNFGAIKPLEMELTYYAGYAWNCDKRYVPEDDEETWVADWLDETFTGRHGGELAGSLLLFDQVTNTRKIELMTPEVFSQTAGGDEAAARLHIYEVILSKADAVYEQLPENERDAFYELVLMRIHAAYETCAMFYYADRSVHDMDAGKAADAQRAYDLAQNYRRLRAAMLWHYNHDLQNGKWNGILTPDDFPPPRAAIYPPMQRPLAPVSDQLIVTLPGEGVVLHGTTDTPAAEGAAAPDTESVPFGPGMTYVRPVTKWMELANAGTDSITVTISTPAWIVLSGLEEEESVDEEDRLVDLDGRQTARITIEQEMRVFAEVDWRTVGLHPQSAPTVEDEILLYCHETDETVTVPVRAMLARNAHVPAQGGIAAMFDHMEDDGMVCLEATTAQELEAVHDANEHRRNSDRTLHTTLHDLGAGTGWRVIPSLGRMRGALVEAVEPGSVLTYDFTVTGAVSPDYVLELHRFPSLDSTGEISVEIAIDDHAFHALVTEANDAYRGTWLTNVKDGVDRMTMELPGLAAGSHTLRIRAVQPYLAFSRIVIYAAGAAHNNLGLQFYDDYFGRLPEVLDVEAFADRYYGAEAWQGELQPVVWLHDRPLVNANRCNNIYAMPGEPRPMTLTTEPVQERAGEIVIEPVAALLESAAAWTEAGAVRWRWADAPTHGGAGLSLYLRAQGDVAASLETAPSLHYRVAADGGRYRIWARVLFWGRQSAHMTISMDGRLLPADALYDGQSIWSYSAENAWVWVPLAAVDLTTGDHEIGFHLQSGMTRLAQIVLTRGGRRPAAE